MRRHFARQTWIISIENCSNNLIFGGHSTVLTHCCVYDDNILITFQISDDRLDDKIRPKMNNVYIVSTTMMWVEWEEERRLIKVDAGSMNYWHPKSSCDVTQVDNFARLSSIAKRKVEKFDTPNQVESSQVKNVVTGRYRVEWRVDIQLHIRRLFAGVWNHCGSDDALNLLHIWWCRRRVKIYEIFHFSSCLIRRFWSTVCAEKKKSGIFSIHKMISQSKLTSKPSDFAQTPPSSPAIQALETHCDAINWLST